MRYNMVTVHGNGFYEWDGRIYNSDIVRSAIRPKVKAIGKLVGRHLLKTTRGGDKKIEVNPDPRIRFLMEEPNPYMTGQDLQEKLAAQLCLNNNAFAVIIRNNVGVAAEIYPIPANSVEVIYSKAGDLFLRFYFDSGKNYIFPYEDIIHLRQDFYDNDIFGTTPARALIPLMRVVTTTDQGIISAIKNSTVIRWLLKFSQSIRPEDIETRVNEFSRSYLDVTKGVGVAGIDPKADAVQVKPMDYVPNAAQMDRTRQRILALFNTNEKIIQSSYSEDEWISYYEAELAPVISKLANEYSRKLFSRRERAFGNEIVFESSRLSTASMKTKLALIQLVDRGIITPNEHREILNYAPIPGGDEAIRRLDTVPVSQREQVRGTGTGAAESGGDADES